ncbi:hypothetical protein PPERSA_12772 [Pseudocohnilembus persalinus]|uniref:Uncharacterized protein n=1 Tax=Pseudocohnilembus persalinus TaxID=266149 RepID=A0A0V0QUA7_PSEPJ|nr:hypothetical protein PPERSA_12772 [Pseudocohnilembus persalinus]|eukprot:KRX05594.1 hypothetical protein PPERSA_12772 [Pseudocohnilembus persalinus]
MYNEKQSKISEANNIINNQINMQSHFTISEKELFNLENKAKNNSFNTFDLQNIIIPRRNFKKTQQNIKNSSKSQKELDESEKNLTSIFQEKEIFKIHELQKLENSILEVAKNFESSTAIEIQNNNSSRELEKQKIISSSIQIENQDNLLLKKELNLKQSEIRRQNEQISQLEFHNTRLNKIFERQQNPDKNSASQ